MTPRERTDPQQHRRPANGSAGARADDSRPRARSLGNASHGAGVDAGRFPVSASSSGSIRADREARRRHTSCARSSTFCARAHASLACPIDDHVVRLDPSGLGRAGCGRAWTRRRCFQRGASAGSGVCDGLDAAAGSSALDIAAVRASDRAHRPLRVSLGGCRDVSALWCGRMAARSWKLRSQASSSIPTSSAPSSWSSCSRRTSGQSEWVLDRVRVLVPSRLGCRDGYELSSRTD